MQKPAPISHLRHHRSDHQRDGRQITSSADLDADSSLICSFTDLQSRLPEANPLPLKESYRGNMFPNMPSRFRTESPHDYNVGGRKQNCQPPTTSPAQDTPSFSCNLRRQQSARTSGQPLRLHSDAGENVVATTKPKNTNPPRGRRRRHAIPAWTDDQPASSPTTEKNLEHFYSTPPTNTPKPTHRVAEN